jgi:hypothetical protein
MKSTTLYVHAQDSGRRSGVLSMCTESKLYRSDTLIEREQALNVS